MAKLADIGRSDGHLIELFICDELRKRGYVILEQNYMVGKLEIDIIAMDGDVLCFIEVKSRSRPIIMSEINQLVTYEQQQRIVFASDTYCQKLKGLKYSNVRFDYILVYMPNQLTPKHIKHIKNAFVPTLRR